MERKGTKEMKVQRPHIASYLLTMNFNLHPGPSLLQHLQEGNITCCKMTFGR